MKAILCVLTGFLFLCTSLHAQFNKTDQVGQMEIHNRIQLNSLDGLDGLDGLDSLPGIAAGYGGRRRIERWSG